MEIRCPKCNSRDIRYSHLSTPKERFASLLGIHPLRCRDCRERFVARLWDPSDLPYARCPRCLNMTLSTWSPSHYHVPAGRGIKLFFGEALTGARVAAATSSAFGRGNTDLSAPGNPLHRRRRPERPQAWQTRTARASNNGQEKKWFQVTHFPACSPVCARSLSVASSRSGRPSRRSAQQVFPRRASKLQATPACSASRS